jgi:hypothetical protein
VTPGGGRQLAEVHAMRARDRQACPLAGRRAGVGRLPVTDPLTGRLAGIMTRFGLVRVHPRPCEEIRARDRGRGASRVPGAYPCWLRVDVRDGVVTISGRVGRRPAVSGLVTAALQAEGVIQVDVGITPI